MKSAVLDEISNKFPKIWCVSGIWKTPHRTKLIGSRGELYPVERSKTNSEQMHWCYYAFQELERFNGEATACSPIGNTVVRKVSGLVHFLAPTRSISSSSRFLSGSLCSFISLKNEWLRLETGDDARRGTQMRENGGALTTCIANDDPALSEISGRGRSQHGC